MPDNGAATHGRPLCRCHGEPLASNGKGTRQGGRTECLIKRRARQAAAYHAKAEHDNYARTRRRLRARIAEKRQRIAHLEAQLEEENTG